MGLDALDPLGLLRLGRKLRPIKWFWQRGRRGYSDQDVWNLDHYLFGVLSRALADLAENHISFPGGEISDEAWTKELRYGAEVCARLYADDYDGDYWADQNELDYVKFITWFSRWLGHLWD